MSATIVGTSGRDVLSGTGKRDVIVSLQGADRITGIGHGDVVCSGSGDDELLGDAGRVFAGAGDDRARSGVGAYVGGSGDDHMYVRYGSVKGGRGSDRLASFGSVDGGRGDDHLRGGQEVVAGSGDDLLEAMPYCGPYMSPGAGRDLVVGGSGSCLPEEGSSETTLDFGKAPDGVTVNLRKGFSSGWGRDRVTGVANVIGSRHDDVLIGTAGKNRLTGSGGSDRIVGAGGPDALDGDDAFHPGEGGGGTASSDVLDGGAGRDVLYGREGDDRLFGRGGNDEMNAGEGADLIDGGQGSDDFATFEVDIESSDTGVDVNLKTGEVSGRGSDTLVGAETIEGSSYNDLFIGDDAGTTFIPGYGDDNIEAGGGDDVIIDPHPRAWPPAGDDTYDGGLGVDTVSWETADEAMIVDLLAGTASGDGSDTLAAIEVVIGSKNADRIFGDGADNRFFGGAGDDQLDGRGGHDYVDGGLGVDTCVGEEVKDCP